MCSILTAQFTRAVLIVALSITHTMRSLWLIYRLIHPASTKQMIVRLVKM